MNNLQQKCDFCKEPAVYDGKTVFGPWAFMCENHFKLNGYNLNGMFSKLEVPKDE